MTKVECYIAHYVICLRDKFVTDCVTIWPKSGAQAVIRTIENPRIRRIRVSSCFPVFVRVFLTNKQTNMCLSVCLSVCFRQTDKQARGIITEGETEQFQIFDVNQIVAEKY